MFGPRKWLGVLSEEAAPCALPPPGLSVSVSSSGCFITTPVLAFRARLCPVWPCLHYLITSARTFFPSKVRVTGAGTGLPVSSGICLSRQRPPFTWATTVPEPHLLGLVGKERRSDVGVTPSTSHASRSRSSESGPHPRGREKPTSDSVNQGDPRAHPLGSLRLLLPHTSTQKPRGCRESEPPKRTGGSGQGVGSLPSCIFY